MASDHAVATPLQPSAQFVAGVASARARICKARAGCRDECRIQWSTWVQFVAGCAGARAH
eukprot:NODE_27826_length_499_cov_2.596774.p4 GENE.NODE_27826_length_499_cov_2.596774~~NODE_27826_length_499_cov_2.596774.p4  ORF type:complete len:60 (+),score=10.38 NODE_27826_length_499_cov_2.596774:164-343(+)